MQYLRQMKLRHTIFISMKIGLLRLNLYACRRNAQNSLELQSLKRSEKRKLNSGWFRCMHSEPQLTRPIMLMEPCDKPDTQTKNITIDHKIVPKTLRERHRERQMSFSISRPTKQSKPQEPTLWKTIAKMNSRTKNNAERHSSFHTPRHPPPLSATTTNQGNCIHHQCSEDNHSTDTS